MDADGIIQTERLTKTYATGSVEVAALRDVTLLVEKGTFVGVTGASANRQIRIGDPLEPEVLMGPLIDEHAVSVFRTAIGCRHSARAPAR